MLVGATGTVGRLTAERLVADAPEGLRIGLAGRNADALEVLRNGLGARAAGWAVVPVDTRDAAQVAALVARTRVVASGVGPYYPHGLLLVEACARAGVHYADITGEALFMRASIDRFHDLAVDTGARIVHATGFDCVPSDLAMQALAERVRHDDVGEVARATLYWRRIRGAVGAGTITSIVDQIDAAALDPAARRVVTDPFSLCPGQEPTGTKSTRARRHRLPVWRSDDLHGWTGPFVMGSVNTQIVNRSNLLSGWSYGNSLRYGERVDTGSVPIVSAAKAAGLAALIPAAMGALTFAPTRALVDRVLPRLPDGPTRDSRERGCFRGEIRAVTTTGAAYASVVDAPYDPAYEATCRMFAESALLLAEPPAGEPAPGGVLTAAPAFGPQLRDRLVERDFRFATRRLDESL